jgi:hypothetical protein
MSNDLRRRLSDVDRQRSENVLQPLEHPLSSRCREDSAHGEDVTRLTESALDQASAFQQEHQTTETRHDAARSEADTAPSPSLNRSDRRLALAFLR